jgi:CO/xanthine dehydrogenase FAD-binding subunit
LSDARLRKRRANALDSHLRSACPAGAAATGGSSEPKLRALRARAAEDSLRGNAINDTSIAEAARLAMSICDPAADQRGDVEYKIAMSGEMTRRALRTARLRARY